MKLFHSPASPYVRKVMIVAHELGLVDQLDLVQRPSTPLAPDAELVSFAPVGRIPALVLDDGTLLVDSRVICRYLNHLGGGSLYPAGADEFPAIAREAMAEGMIDSALLSIYEKRLRPEEKQFPDYIAGQKAKIERGLANLEGRVDELGGPLTIDQIAVGAMLGYLNFRMPDFGWQAACPTLSGWFDSFEQRPSMQATMPVG